MSEKYIYDVETYPSFSDAVLKSYVDKNKLSELMEYYSTDDLIDLIGVDEIQKCLRKRKLKDIKNG
jgi:hypothetical protein